MGDEVTRAALQRSDPKEYQRQLLEGRDALALMLDEGLMEESNPLTGVELELNLIDQTGGPAFNNDAILRRLNTDGQEEAFYGAQKELGSFNLELNLPPRYLEGNGIAWYESDLAAAMGETRDAAAKSGSQILAIGTLPSLFDEHVDSRYLSSAPRYRLLDQQILNLRGDNIQLRIDGAETLTYSCDTIIPEAASTSIQFHLQVPASQFAHYWNIAQVLCGIQIAMGANSPFLLGKQLWPETRIILFEQGTDTRPASVRQNGALPRAWFGEKYIDSPIELFEENYKHFAPLLPITDEENPLALVAAGVAPKFNALRLHNGTVYRWNRPVYDISDGKPHLRVENRVVPAGPSPVDMGANMALYYGLLLYYANAPTPIYNQMPFDVAALNFHNASRFGIHADLIWPVFGQISARTLLLEHLLPLAAQGLGYLKVNSRDIERYLGVIEQRCKRGVNGATWQVARVAVGEHRHRLSREDALKAMACDYSALMMTGLPVHEWEV